MFDSAREVAVTFGGTNGSIQYGDTWEWDGLAWAQRSTIGPTARSDCGMAYDSTRRVAVLFGGGYFGPSTANLNETWEWDGISWALRATSGPSPRSAHLAFDEARGVTVLFGGARSGSPSVTYFGETWEWNGAVWTLASATGPSPRTGHAMAYDASNSVTVLFGGGSSATGLHLADTWQWNGSTWTQRFVSGPPGRFGAGMAFDRGRARIVLTGGIPNGDEVFNDTWDWDGSAWTDRSSPKPSRRTNAAASFDSARSATVLFGGSSQAGAVHHGDTWEWGGTSWALRATGGPPGRSQHAMAYDSLRHRSVLFGGVNANGTTALGDTWEWDGTAWTQQSSIGLPAQYGHAMAFDQARGVTVLFGTSQGIGTTWVWNGVAWTQRAATGPSARTGHAMAFDATRNVTVLFGGTGTPGNDTWEWDGATWTQRAASGPSARIMHSMAYDAGRGRVVLVGGRSSTSSPVSFDETWEWDGSSWSQQTTALSPGAGSGHAAAYDTQRSKTVLFGGSDRYLREQNDTWEYGSQCAPPTIAAQPTSVAASVGTRATFQVTPAGTTVTSFRWRKNGVNLANGAAISGATTDTLVIDPVAASDVGVYDCALGYACGVVLSQGATLSLTCYPNCDQSSVPPALNVQDFLCFLNKFASGDPYANCDASTIPPTLNVADFTCFLNAFASGCP